MRIIRSTEDIEEGLAALVVLDSRLEEIVAYAGDVPLRRQPPGFEGLANIIVSQMISKAAASSIWSRLSSLCEDNVSAERILAAELQTLRDVGLSGAKANTLQRSAEAVCSGAVDLEAICSVDAQDAIRQLTAIKGIGTWTAEVYLMFCAGHLDIFPVGDVALQSAVGNALGLAERPKGKVLAQIAEIWSPWRSVAARLFWAYYARMMKREADPFA